MRTKLEAELVSRQQDNASLRLEMDRLQAVLKETQAATKKQFEQSVSQRTHLEQEMEQLKQALEESEARVQGLSRERAAWQESLQWHTQRQVNDMACHTDTVQRKLSNKAPQTDPVAASPRNCGSLSSASSSPAKRLSRIRQAAEQAISLQNFRREITPIKSEFGKRVDTEIQRLE